MTNAVQGSITYLKPSKYPITWMIRWGCIRYLEQVTVAFMWMLTQFFIQSCSKHAQCNYFSLMHCQMSPTEHMNLRPKCVPHLYIRIYPKGVIMHDSPQRYPNSLKNETYIEFLVVYVSNNTLSVWEVFLWDWLGTNPSYLCLATQNPRFSVVSFLSLTNFASAIYIFIFLWHFIKEILAFFLSFLIFSIFAVSTSISSSFMSLPYERCLLCIYLDAS